MKTVSKTPAAIAAEDRVSEAHIGVGDAAPNAASPSSVSPGPTVLRLNPAEVFPGSGPNRLEEAYQSEEFAALSDSILATRGNLTPITVCVLSTDEVPPGTQYKYLLVSGSRRLRACLENKIRVLALVIQQGALPLEVVRAAENQLREPLKAIEFGRQLLVIVQRHPHLSKRTIAKIMGRDSAQIERCLDIAELPAEIVDCFASPTDIRTNDATPLTQALRQAKDAVIAAAEEIRKGPPLKAAEVVKRLSEAADAAAPPPPGKGKKKGDESFITPLEIDGEHHGEMKQDKSGRQVITLEVSLNDAQRQALSRQLQRFLREKVLGQKKPKKMAKPLQPEVEAPQSAVAQEAAS